MKGSIITVETGLIRIGGGLVVIVVVVIVVVLVVVFAVGVEIRAAVFVVVVTESAETYDRDPASSKPCTRGEFALAPTLECSEKDQNWKLQFPQPDY